MAQTVPVDSKITLDDLHRDPFPIYQRLRQEAPVLRVNALNRVMLTKYDDTKHVKETPEIFSSNDPNTPMKRAFQAHTLMRKDGEEHGRERNAFGPTFAPKVIVNEWVPAYHKIAEEYVSRLPRGEVVDIFSALSAPYAARGLAVLLGMDEASDAEMERWSQTLIDGAGNFGFRDQPFKKSDAANIEMNTLLDKLQRRHKDVPNNSAFSVMLNAEDPIAESQIYSNIKIAIGGGINEPRDAFCTTLFGLLTRQEQLREVKQKDDWIAAFEEGIRWVAPISVSSRLVMQDTVIRGYQIAKGETVMTIQASANRDEDIFENGEEFEVYREKKPHQAFGNGPHFCIGAHVARRAVGQVLLPMLFDRFPKMRLPNVDDVLWRGFGFRGPVQMPVLLQ